MNALELRDELRQQLVAATAIGGQAQAELERLTQELKQNDGQRREAVAAQIRGIPGDDPNEVAKARSALLRRQRDTEDALDGAGVAIGRVKQEIAALQQSRLDEFVEHAEQLSEIAVDALKRLQAPYLAAVDAWSAATSEWRSLQPQLAEAVAADDVQLGFWRDHSVIARRSSPQKFPIDVPADVFTTGHTPRPVVLAPPEPEEQSELDEATSFTVVTAR